MDNWEEVFKAWSKGPSKTEGKRSENAISMIREAINASEALKKRDVTIFLQGSYRNRVNVKQDSDVDIGIVCNSVLYNEYPEGTNRDTFGYTESKYTYSQFKNDTKVALVAKFGKSAVFKGNKAFDIKANNYRIEADVAPFMQHRRLKLDGSYDKGVQLFSDSGKEVINWPEQHYNNGVNKNSNCSQRYKRLVRILKKLKNTMDEKGVHEANNIPGFLCECLVWNVPNNCFNNNTYTQDLKESLVYLHKELGNDDSNQWGEVSELKYLFSSQQKWTKSNARKFIAAAWNYVEFQ